MAALGGRVYIADSSAWARAPHARIRKRWAEALSSRQIATCPVVKLELLYSAAHGSDYDERDALLSALRDVPVTRSVTNAALAAFRSLAHERPLHHRSVKLPDLLIAACAQDAGIGVVHYDAHFDALAKVLDFESRWIAPRGSLT